MESWSIPIVAIICAVGMPVLLLTVFVIKTIQAKHKERMAMIEKGIMLEEPEKKVNKFNALRNGLLMIGLALGAMAGLFFSESLAAVSNDGEDLSIVIFTVLGGGIAYLIYFFIILKMMEKEKQE